ncbi:MAG: cupin domain-containing protein [Dehalococcoidia bacterium]
MKATVLAPDGIAIHTFEAAPASLLGIAEGRIPRGRFAIHRHLALEQYTYVLSGVVTAITGNDEYPQGVATELGSGALLLTLPGETLQFVNEHAEPARVLFVCSPPYPADDAGTQVLAHHADRIAADAHMTVAHLLSLRDAFNLWIETRLQALTSP